MERAECSQANNPVSRQIERITPARRSPPERFVALQALSLRGKLSGEGHDMNLIACRSRCFSLVADAMVTLSRFFQKLPWVVGAFFGLAILYIFAAGLMGVAYNLHLL